MTCTSCGDKPKGSSKGFPRAVVEINNPESLVLLRKVVIPVSMGTEEDVPPAIGKYFNVLLQYESNGHIYLYSSDGIPTAIEANIPQEVLDRISTLESDVDLLEIGLAKETEDREKADGVLQQEIDDIKNSPDVVDIVATYSDLMAYDTSSLGDNDVIRVLRDETHDGQSAYYRWDKPHSTWTFIGTVGDYYTKQQVDTLLDGKQDELTPGENISIVDESGDLVISAQDTTYTAGYGLELNDTEFSVDPDIVQDTLTAGDNITIEDESGSLVISATDTTYTAGSGLNLTGTTFSVDTSTIATQADLDTKQDVLTAGQNIHITDESGNLVISADSTTYTAGEAIDITNSVISATNTGKAKVLTTADYNWPVDNPTSVAMWLLPDGAYTNPNGLTIKTSSSSELYPVEKTFIVGSHSNGKYYLLFTNANAGANKETIVYGPTSQSYSDRWSVLTRTNVVDNLTSTSTGAPLSANQGKVLKDLIDAIPAPTTYTAGTGLDLTGTEFSVDFNDVQGKLTAGDNITIADESGDLVISATDTTYTAGTGIAINNGVISATNTGPTVVQTTGTSTTDVMSQNAVTSMVFADPSTKQKVQLGAGAVASASYSVSIGRNASTYGADSVAVGHSSQANYASCVTVGSSAKSTDNYAVAIGAQAKANMPYSVAVGTYAIAGAKGEMNIGTGAQTTAGYNNSNYRLLSGVYDGQSAHDAATKGQLDAAVNTIDTALDAKQDVLTAGDNITIQDESGDLVISATDTTYTAGAGLNLVGTQFAVDTTTIATQTDLANKLDNSTTFWGQTANNGVVDGTINISSNSGLAGMSLGAGHLDIDRPASFYLRAKKNASTYSNVLWWNSASNNVPSNVHLDAAETKMTLLTNEVRLGGRYSSDNVKISNVATPQSAQDAATKGYVDTAVGAKQDVLTAGDNITIAEESGALVISATGGGASVFTTNEWNALWA